MLCRALAFLVLVVAALIGWLVNSAIVTMAYDRELVFSDNSRCRSLDAPTSCEDLTAYGEGLAIASCGDLLGLFANGSASAETPGAFFLVDPGKLTMTKIEATGPPLDVVHGLYYSKTSSRLYVVHHNERAGESVEVQPGRCHCPPRPRSTRKRGAGRGWLLPHARCRPLNARRRPPNACCRSPAEAACTCCSTCRCPPFASHGRASCMCTRTCRCPPFARTQRCPHLRGCQSPTRRSRTRRCTSVDHTLARSIIAARSAATFSNASQTMARGARLDLTWYSGVTARAGSTRVAGTLLAYGGCIGDLSADCGHRDILSSAWEI